MVSSTPTPEDDLLREASERLTERIEALFDEVDPATHDEISQFTYEALATRLQPAAHQPVEPMKMLVDADWLRRKVESEPDGFDVEAGQPAAPAWGAKAIGLALFKANAVVPLKWSGTDLAYCEKLGASVAAQLAEIALPPPAPGLDPEAVARVIREQLTDEHIDIASLNCFGRPDVLVAGCKAVGYPNPEDAAEKFAALVAKAIIAMAPPADAGPMGLPSGAHVRGTGRDGEMPNCLILYTDRRPADDDLRYVHDLFAGAS